MHMPEQHTQPHLSSQAAVPFRLLSWRHWACSPAWVASGGEEPPSEGVLRIHSDWMPPLPPTCERGAWTHNSVNPLAAGCIQLQCNSGIAAHEGWQLSTLWQALHLHQTNKPPPLACSRWRRIHPSPPKLYASTTT